MRLYSAVTKLVKGSESCGNLHSYFLAMIEVYMKPQYGRATSFTFFKALQPLPAM